MTDNAINSLITNSAFHGRSALQRAFGREKTRLDDDSNFFSKDDLLNSNSSNDTDINANFIAGIHDENLESAIDFEDSKISYPEDGAGSDKDSNRFSTLHSKLNLTDDTTISDIQLINEASNVLTEMKQSSLCSSNSDVIFTQRLCSMLKQLRGVLLLSKNHFGVSLVSNDDVVNNFDKIVTSINNVINDDYDPLLQQETYTNLQNDLSILTQQLLKQYEEIVFVHETQKTHSSFIQLIDQSYRDEYSGKVDIAKKYDMQPLVFTRRGNSWYGLKSILHAFRDNYHIKHKDCDGVKFKVFSGDPLSGLKIDSYVMKDSGDLVLSIAGTKLTDINDLLDDLMIVSNSGGLLKSQAIDNFIDAVVLEWKNATQGLKIDRPQTYIIGHSLGARIGAYVMSYLERKYNFDAHLNTFEDPGGHSTMLAQQLHLPIEDQYIKKDTVEKTTIINSRVDNIINGLHDLEGINQYQYWSVDKTQDNSVVSTLCAKKWLVGLVLERSLIPFKLLPHKFILSDQDLHNFMLRLSDSIPHLLDKLDLSSHTVESLENDIERGILVQKVGKNKVKIPSKYLFDDIKQQIIEFSNNNKSLYHNNILHQCSDDDVITIIYENDSLSLRKDDFLRFIERGYYPSTVQDIKSLYENTTSLLCSINDELYNNINKNVVLDDNVMQMDNNLNIQDAGKLEDSKILGSVAVVADAA